MIIFYLLLVLFTLIALAFVLTPLLHASKKKSLQPTQLSVTLYREQLQNLDEQLKKNEILLEDYQLSREELEQSLLDETSANEIYVAEKKSPNYLTAIVLLIILPAAAILLYLHWGNSQSFFKWRIANQQAAQIKADMAAYGSTQNIIHALQEKLQENPDSAKGWYLLGRLYMSQQQPQQAVQAFAKANHLQPDDIQIMQNYAASLFFANHEKLDTQSRQLLQKVMALQTDNLDAMNLYALGAYRDSDYQTAIQYWEKLLSLVPQQSDASKELLAMIAQAQQQLAAKSSPIKIQVQVSLAKALQNKVNPNDIVFIYAKALNGPPMPLAVVRQQVRDLPTTIVLTPADAMISTASLANYSQIRILARISKSGQVMPQTGDLQGESQIVNVHSKKPVVIVIKDMINM